MKKHLLTNSYNGGGITNLKRNAFTLIELLAIIVILAIIAVITVPIILNIIENSRKGAATDSAYGYKDSVNKTYVAELQNHNKLKLDGKYAVNSNGSLTPAEDNTFGFGDENVTSFPVQVSGSIPSSGKLRYSNNVLDGGCLVIGDYKITFKSDGSVNETEKGNCDDYVFSGGSGQGEDPALVNYTMDEMCPGCVFSTSTEQQCVNQALSISAVNDYTSLNAGAFLGFIVKDNIVKRAFACGTNGTNFYCVEGDDLKLSRNKQIMKHFFPSCNVTDDINEQPAYCQNGNYLGQVGSSGGFVETEDGTHYLAVNFGCTGEY